jgi:hypothetical protein
MSRENGFRYSFKQLLLLTKTSEEMLPLFHLGYMKRIFLAVLLFAAISGWSQKAAIINVYAYAQSVTPGTPPTVLINEGGKEEKTQPVERVNYFLYAEQRRTTHVSFTTVWIKGIPYPVKADSVSITPVEMGSPGKEIYMETITLVPKTRQKVWSISPGAALSTPGRPSATLQKLIKKSALVLVYKWKGRLYYYAVKKINKLAPALSV